MKEEEQVEGVLFSSFFFSFFLMDFLSCRSPSFLSSSATFFFFFFFFFLSVYVLEFHVLNFWLVSSLVLRSLSSSLDSPRTRTVCVVWGGIDDMSQ